MLDPYNTFFIYQGDFCYEGEPPNLQSKKLDQLSNQEKMALARACIEQVCLHDRAGMQQLLSTLGWYSLAEVKEIKGIKFANVEKLHYNGSWSSIHDIDLKKFTDYDVERYVKAGCPPFTTIITLPATSKFMIAVKEFKDKQEQKKLKAAMRKKEKQLERAKKIIEANQSTEKNLQKSSE